MIPGQPWANYRQSIPESFTKAPLLERPSDPDKIESLKKKLAGYRSRLRVYGPILAGHQTSGQRELEYQIEILEAVIGLKGGEAIAPRELFRKAVEKVGPGGYVSTMDYYVACAVIGGHLGIAFPGIEIVSSPKPAMAA